MFIPALLICSWLQGSATVRDLKWRIHVLRQDKLKVHRQKKRWFFFVKRTLSFTPSEAVYPGRVQKSPPIIKDCVHKHLIHINRCTECTPRLINNIDTVKLSVLHVNES